MPRRSLCPLTFVLFGILCVGVMRGEEPADDAQSPDTSAATSPAPAVNPSGSWHWEYTSPDGNSFHFSLKLVADGEKISGKYTAFDHTMDVENAKLDGDKLSFRVHDTFNGSPLTVDFNGQVKPDDIVGIVNVDFGDGAREFDWHAERRVDLEDVLGTWKLRVELPDRVFEPQITIAKADDGLRGLYVSRLGEREAKNVNLDKDKNELTWEISGELQGYTFKEVYHGQPRGNSIAGVADYDFGGDTGTMKFTGKLQPKKTNQPVASASQPADHAAEADGTATDPE